MQTLYCATASIGIIALLMLEHIARRSDLLAPSNKRSFCLSAWTVLIVMAAEVVTILAEGASAKFRILHLLGNLLGFSLSPFIPLLIGCAIGAAPKKPLLFLWGPSVLNLLLCLLSAFFPLIFWVDAGNGYARGHVFWVYVVAYSAALLFLLFQTLTVTRRYQNSSRALPVVLFCFVVLGTTVQVAVPQLHTSWLCVSFALILYYMYYWDLLHQIDVLTGLLNRRTFDYNLSRIRHSGRAAIILFDVDDFKTINDTYGHLFGDHCLVSAAACIKKAFSGVGLCFRIGGDEFCVIARKTNQAALKKAHRRFLYEIESRRKKDPRLPLVSIGYALANDRSVSIRTLLSEADQNMYQFKRQRKSQAAAQQDLHRLLQHTDLPDDHLFHVPGFYQRTPPKQ